MVASMSPAHRASQLVFAVGKTRAGIRFSHGSINRNHGGHRQCRGPLACRVDVGGLPRGVVRSRLRTEGSADAAEACRCRSDERPRIGGRQSGRGSVEAMKLPGAPYVAYRGDELFIEDCSLTDLARAHGTPLYAYSRTAMLEALGGYQRALAGRDHLVCYAMRPIRAWPWCDVCTSRLRFRHRFGRRTGTRTGRRLTGAKNRLSGVGKRRDELRSALDADVCCFASGRLNSICCPQSRRDGPYRMVSLRINPVSMPVPTRQSTGLKSNKFGCARPSGRGVPACCDAAGARGRRHRATSVLRSRGRAATSDALDDCST